MSDTTYIVKFSTSQGAKVFEFKDYEKAMERYQTPYWGNPAECLTTVSGSIGPFPQEPAPGSQEAVAQAAGTIEALRYALAYNETADDHEMVAHPEGEWVPWAEHEQLRQQRDELADALEFLLLRVADWHEHGRMSGSPLDQFPAIRHANAALRAAGRLP